jgi:hypothetical protein
LNLNLPLKFKFTEFEKVLVATKKLVRSPRGCSSKEDGKARSIAARVQQQRRRPAAPSEDCLRRPKNGWWWTFEFEFEFRN